MKIYETKETLTVQQIEVGIKCDCCGKTESDPRHWFNFNSHHSGWGNDSIDSYEYFDVCSPECFIKQIGEELERLRDNQNTGEIAEMSYKFAQNMYNSYYR